MDDDFEDRIQSLQDDINQLSEVSKTTKNTQSVKNKYKFTLMNFDIINLPIVYYLIIPCLILFFLLSWKPNFVMEDISLKQTEKKVNYKKLVIATFIGTLIIKTISIIYVFVYKNKK